MAVGSLLRRMILPGALVLGVTLSPSPAQATESPDVDRDLAAVEAATSKYKDVEAALADGFVATDVCAESPEGTMGYHYAHPQRLEAPVELTEPALLVYQPGPSGDRKLVAVEWFQVDDDQDLATDEDKPSLFGRPFDGPMEGHEPGMPIHYDLHAWLYQDNPDGMFEAWNPAGSCETGDGEQVSMVPVGGAATGGASSAAVGSGWLLGLGAAIMAAGALLLASGRLTGRRR